MGENVGQIIGRRKGCIIAYRLSKQRDRLGLR